MRDFNDIAGARVALKQLSDRLDRLESQNINAHGRRVVNAGNAVDPQDYVTKADVTKIINNQATSSDQGDGDSSIIGGIVVHRLAHTFNKIVKFLSGIIVGLIYPASDSTTAIKITKADGTTVIARLDSTNKAFILENGVGIQAKDTAATIVNLLVHYTDDEVYLDNVSGGINIRTASGTQIRTTGATIGFFGATVAAKQTLNAYTTNSQSSTYISTPAALAQAATLSDLNTLRAAYENIRASYDDTRTKLKTTTLVG